MNERFVRGSILKISRNEIIVFQVSRSCVYPIWIVGVRPILQPCHQSSFEWVQVDVSAKVQKIFLFINMNGFETRAEQGAVSSKLNIDGLNKGIEKNLHENRQADHAVLAKQKVIMVGHEAVGNHGDRMRVQVFLHQSQKVKVVFFGVENFATIYTPIIDVVVVTLVELYFSARHCVAFAIKPPFRRLENQLNLWDSVSFESPELSWVEEPPERFSGMLV